MEEKQKLNVKKVGFKTLGVILILFGILFLINFVFKIDVLRYILNLWPIILIFLGIEILIEGRKNEIKISVGSMILSIILILSSFLFGMFAIFMNEILYSDELANSLNTKSTMYYISNDEKITISNYQQKDVYLKIIESNGQNSHIYTKLKYNENMLKNSNLISILERINGENAVILKDNNSLAIFDLKDNVDYVEITAVVSNKNNVITEGNVICK